jgi:hypothetical protein
MTSQGHLIDTPTELSAAFHAEAVLDEVTLEAILELNLDFLRLLERRHRAQPTRSCAGLGPATLARLCALAPLARRRLAACPYTLFDMRFADVAFWSAPALTPEAEGDTVDSVPIAIGFAQVAAFFAWHIARGDALTAALVLGMDPLTHATWRTLSLASLAERASLALSALSARFTPCPGFWSALIADAVSPGQMDLQATRLQGLQLLAATRIDASHRGRSRDLRSR